MSNAGPQLLADGQSQNPQTFVTKLPPAYEFPKRKRWADLLLTELVDNIAFILSPSCKIWFVGTSVTEILGWRDAELIDLDFTDLVDPNDRTRFNDAFQQAIQNSVEFNLPIKLNSSDSSLPTSVPSTRAKSVMFEMKCYPYISMDKGEETRCLVAMAAPSPSRNTAMLNTILDLQTRQDHLRRKVAEYRERVPPEPPSAGQSPSSQSGSMYATSSLNSTAKKNAGNPTQNKSADSAPGSSFLSTVLLSASLEGNARGNADSGDFSNAGLYEGGSTNGEEDDGSKKKKLKRAQNVEQHVCVTCGRTNSPEWRKGPLGPKTLCNACGLRWAKSQRRVDDPAEKSVALSTVADA